MSTQKTDEIETLQEVARLLRENEFASIDDLAARSGVERLADVTDDLVDRRKVVEMAPDITRSTSPLPKRRSA